MKKIMVIFFLLTFLIAHTSVGELLRLPVLVHHYNEHVVLDNNNSFVDFLVEHYSKKINHPDDKHHDHENLPFKSTGINHILVTAIEPQSTYYIFETTPFILKKKEPILVQHHYSSACLGTIWQPPRFC